MVHLLVFALISISVFHVLKLVLLSLLFSGQLWGSTKYPFAKCFSKMKSFLQATGHSSLEVYILIVVPPVSYTPLRMKVILRLSYAISCNGLSWTSCLRWWPSFTGIVVLLRVWQEKGTKRNLLLSWAADRNRADIGKVKETGLLVWQVGAWTQTDSNNLIQTGELRLIWF